MAKQVIVAFTGYKGSGKDTAAKIAMGYLMSNFHSCLQINFADKVKSLCMDIYGLSYAECYNQDLKEVVLERWPFKSPRFLMQEFATEMFRVRYPDIWVRYWGKDVLKASQQFIFTTDLRFPNEVVALKALGGFIVKVDRPGLVKDDSHASESHYDQIPEHFLLRNDQDITTLSARTTQHLIPKLLEKLHAYDRPTD